MKTGHTSWARSNIFGFKKQQDCRIDHVELLPAHPEGAPRCARRHRGGGPHPPRPGSLYTSIIPNLLVDGVAEAIAASDAQKIYVCNIMTQDGETEATPPPTIWRALLRHGTADMWSCALPILLPSAGAGGALPRRGRGGADGRP